VGRLRLIDFDQVSLSSLNRHAVATRADVGMPKAICLQVCSSFRADSSREISKDLLLAVPRSRTIWRPALVNLFCIVLAASVELGRRESVKETLPPTFRLHAFHI